MGGAVNSTFNDINRAIESVPVIGKATSNLLNYANPVGLVVNAAKAIDRGSQGIESVKRDQKAAKTAQEQAVAKQNAAAAAQAEAIRTAPKVMGRQTLTAQDRRFRAGLTANIRAANLGPAPLAPAAATGKPKLGQ